MDNDLKRSLIKLMVTIVERGKGERIAELCLREHLHFHFICLGLGTASSEILDYFGLGETAKDVVISMVPDYKVPELMPMISEQMQLKKTGARYRVYHSAFRDQRADIPGADARTKT